MARGKTSYRCVECGYVSAGWLGRCPHCGSWESFAEVHEEKGGSSREHAAAHPSVVTPLDRPQTERVARTPTGIAEFDQVLGGGLVPGAVILIAGPPGIGKSTLLLQVAREVAQQAPIIYASGEESFEQISMRAARLGTLHENILLAADTNLPAVIAAAREAKPALLIVDSVQAMTIPELPSAAGSLVQVREGAQALVSFAKTTGIPVLVIGHVTKEGQIAGPKVLEHVVDTVIYFEGDSSNLFRIVRTTKNRFGPTDEIGVFEMGEHGLVPVKNPSAAFLSGREGQGGIVFPALEGTRVILSEVQSLVTASLYPAPRHIASGIDPTKLNLLIAVLEKRADVSFAGCDVYLSTSSGIRIREPGIDLAAVLALYMGLREESPELVAAFGEVGLDGYVRPIFRPEPRIKEVARMGVKRLVMPRYDRMNARIPRDLEVVEVSTIREALEAVK